MTATIEQVRTGGDAVVSIKDGLVHISQVMPVVLAQIQRMVMASDLTAARRFANGHPPFPGRRLLHKGRKP